MPQFYLVILGSTLLKVKYFKSIPSTNIVQEVTITRGWRRTGGTISRGRNGVKIGHGWIWCIGPHARAAIIMTIFLIFGWNWRLNGHGGWSKTPISSSRGHSSWEIIIHAKPIFSIVNWNEILDELFVSFANETTFAFLRTEDFVIIEWIINYGISWK